MKIWKGILGLGLISAIGGILWKAKKMIEHSDNMMVRYKSYYDMTNQWLRAKNSKKSAIEYFKNNDISKIAIYGLGELGTRLYEEIKDSEIEVAYFIDKNADEIYYGIDDIPVVGINDIASQESVDAIVVTPIYDFEKIEEDLLDIEIDTEILSLEDVIYEL